MRSSKFYLGLLVLIAIGSLLLYEFPPGGISVKLIGNTLQTLANAVAMWFLFRVYRTFGSEDRVRSGWLLMVLAAVTQTLGFGIYGVLEGLGQNAPFPSPADLFWLAAYPLELAALLLLAREYRRAGFHTVSARGTVLVGLVAVAAVAVFLVMPYMQDDSLRFVDKVILVLYPVGDAFFIMGAWYMASLMRPFGRGALTWPWWAMVLGTVLTAGSDSVYALLQLRGLYQTGDLIDLGWVYGSLLIALGGWLQHRIMTYDLVAGGELR